MADAAPPPGVNSAPVHFPVDDSPCSEQSFFSFMLQ
jgi:hypothetical protein